MTTLTAERKAEMDAAFAALAKKHEFENVQLENHMKRTRKADENGGPAYEWREQCRMAEAGLEKKHREERQQLLADLDLGIN
jgi:hypothetical protein